MAEPLEAAKPQFVDVRKQTVPASSAKVIERLAVGAVKPTVEVNEPLVAWSVIAELPFKVSALFVAPTVRSPSGVFSVPLKPLYVACIAPMVTTPPEVLTLNI